MDEDGTGVAFQCFMSLVPGHGLIHIHLFVPRRDDETEFELGRRLGIGALVTSAALLGSRVVHASPR